MIAVTRNGYRLEMENAEVGQRLIIPTSSAPQTENSRTGREAKLVAFVLFTGKPWSKERLARLGMESPDQLPEWMEHAPDATVLAFLSQSYRLRASFIVKNNGSAGSPFVRIHLLTETMQQQFQDLWTRFGVLTKKSSRPDSEKWLLDTSGVFAYRRLRELLPYTGDPYMARVASDADTAAQGTSYGWGTDDTMVDTVTEVLDVSQ